MKFNLSGSLEILEKTPAVLKTMLTGLSTDWTHTNEGSDTWSVFDVIGHLVHGEKTDWIARTRIILEGNRGTFEPFDRFAQFRDSEGKSLDQLLEEFEKLRAKNIEILKSIPIDDNVLKLQGIHPALGEVNLAQLLSTWTVHDMTHIAQISRVMAKQYEDEVGPWKEYLGVLNK